MSKFRKKPVVIDAVQFNQLGDHPAVHADDRSPTGFAIYTLENTKIKHEVTLGDWIITGVQGEVYACKPDIFAKTYDLVEPATKLELALDAVLEELHAARRKFPWWPSDPVHAAAILAEEAGELHKDVLQLVYEPSKTCMSNLHNEAVQTAAMALRFLVNLDRYTFKPALGMPDPNPEKS